MTTAQDFLDTITHLTDVQRGKLRDEELDTPDAIVAFTPEALAKAGEMKLGAAGKLYSAATLALEMMRNKRQNVVDPDRAFNEKKQAARAALEAVAADPLPHRIVALRECGIDYVVQHPDGKINVDGTWAMQQDIDHGAPTPSLWQGERVVSVASLAAPTVLRHPRTGEALQAGKDDLTGIEWASLGLHTLRLVAYGYKLDAFHGMPDTAVFEQAKAGKLTALRSRAINEDFELSTMDSVVVHGRAQMVRQPDGVSPVPHRIVAPAGGSVVARLQKLFLELYGFDELRRMLSYLPDGRNITASLPSGGVSPLQYSFEAAGLLHREGRITTTLRDAMLINRPHRADEINRFFDSVL